MAREDKDTPPLPDDSEKAKALIGYGRVRGPLFDAIMEVITRTVIPWNKLSEQQQRELMASIRSRIDANLERACHIIVNAEMPSITASLGDFTVKSDEITGKFATSRIQNTIRLLGEHGLKPVTIVLNDPKLLDDGSYSEKTKASPDQTRIDDLLDHPADDSDLAGDEEE